MPVVKRSGALTAAEQLKVLALVWDKGHDMDGWVFLPWIPGWCKDKAQRRANWHEGSAFKWPQQRDEILTHLENHRQDDLYFTPNTFLGESRVAQFTGEEKALYADLDEVNPTDDIDPDLRPTIAWETSPGRFQGIWLLDSFADGCTEAGGLNHRLTAAIGADPSGWDTTQLLRVPGRRNFKPGYKDDEGDSPPGRLLWIKAKHYSPDWLDKRLPTVEVYGTGADIEDAEIDSVDFEEVYARARLKISDTVRQYMKFRSRDVTEEYDRSEVLWQIERDLADAGCTVAEIVAIVRKTPWNKHEGRNNEMAQLKSEAAKAIGVAHENAKETPLESEAGPSRSRPDQLMWLSDFTAQRIPRPAWLVRNIWTRGSCGFIAAEPKSYKSYFALDLAISIATGTHFLGDSQFSTRQGAVLYLQEEDAPNLVKHRMKQILDIRSPDAFWDGQMSLDEAYAQGAGIDALGLTWTPPTHDVPLAPHVRTGFQLSSGADQLWLAETIHESKIAMVIVDTLGTSIGDIDINDGPKMYSRVLNPLKEISNQTGCSIAIVHHNSKGRDGSRRGQAMSGTQAFHAWTESALYLSKDDHVTGQPAQIRVERENKLAEDLKFRVRIPPMWEEKGPAVEGARQPWEPEVLIGWGDSNAVEEAQKESTQPATWSRVGDIVQKLGANGRTFTTDEVFLEYGIGQRHGVRDMLRRDSSFGFIEGTDKDGWTLT
jgi:hypothetical protein